MKRGIKIYIGIMALLTASACTLYAQDNSNDDNNSKCKANKPCVHITVHKQLDKDGNIISYDSVYSYTFGGNMADTAFMNSLMKNGNLSIQMHVSPNGNIDFMNDPFFQHFDMNIDMDQVQKMMQQQMQYLMQNAGMNDMQMFFSAPPPASAPPANKQKQHACPKKKCMQKNNVTPQGVQI